MKRLFLFSVVMILLVPTAAWAGTLRGLVTGEQDSGPIPAAKVTLVGAGKVTKTDDQGRFVFENLSAGEYTVAVEAEGYQTHKSKVKVPAEGEIEVTIVLKFSVTVEGEELTVTGHAPVDQSPQTSAQHFTREEVASNAGAFEDVTKTIQQLPGIVADTDFTSDMYVRGSQNWENLIIIDRQLLINPYHFGVGLSVINTDLVDDFTFYAAGFPAEYPFATGSVLDVTYRDGNRDHADGQVSVSMLSASAIATGPLGKKVTWVFSFRRSYYDYMLRLMNWTDFPTPVFSDAFGRLTYEPNDLHRFVLFLMRSQDGVHAVLDENPSSVDEGTVFYNQVTQVYGLDYTFMPIKWFLLNSTLSYQIVNFDGTVNSTGESFFGHALGNTFYYNQEFQFDLGRNVFKLGGVFADARIKLRSAFPLSQFVQGARFSNQQQMFNIDFSTRASTQLYGFYAQHEAEVVPQRLRTNVGARFDHMGDTWVASPRAALSTNLAPDTVLKLAWGVYYSPAADTFASSDEFGNPQLRPQRSTHYVVGIEQGLGPSMKLRIETFYKEFDDLYYMTVVGQQLDLTDTFSLLLQNQLPNIRFTNSGYGQAQGVEVFFQKKISDWWDGWLAYTLSEVRYNDGMGMYGWYYPEQDQRHTLALVANFRPIEDWVFSASFRLTSGRPYTPVVDWVERYPGTFFRFWEAQLGPLNSARFPAYHSLDIRVEHTWHQYQWMDVIGFAEVYNVYNQRNLWGYYYENENGIDKPVRVPIYQLPFLPYLGVKAVFL